MKSIFVALTLSLSLVACDELITLLEPPLLVESPSPSAQSLPSLSPSGEPSPLASESPSPLPSPSVLMSPIPPPTFGGCTNVSSEFLRSDEGWSVVGDAESNTGKPDYHLTDGNPDGYVSADDDAAGGTWYWSAPKEYLGNKSAAYQQLLSFDLKQSDISNQFDDNDLVLVGAGQKLVLDLPNNPGKDWTSYQVILSESSGWKKDSLEGELVSSDEMRRVLGDLSQLWIRGEYVSGNDTGSLDNITLRQSCQSLVSSQVATSLFTDSDEGWVVAGDAENGTGKPDYHTDGGLFGGYLSADDDAAGGVWYWSAPDKFLGNKSGAYGKKLSFKLKQSATSSQFDEIDLILVGSGQKLVLDFASNPDTDWTDYEVILSESADWKKGDLSGEVASESDLRSVLGDLSQLWIRGEYVVGKDTGGLDTVILGG